MPKLLLTRPWPPLRRSTALFSVLQGILSGTLLGILLSKGNPEIASVVQAPLMIGIGILSFVQAIDIGRSN
jgi:hypothetical protein